MAKLWARKLYNSKAWKDVRNRALRRDLYTCTCGARATEVHHIIELTPGNVNNHSIALNIDNLQSLCHDCHDKETKGVSDIEQGYMFDDDGMPIQEVRPNENR